MSNIVLEFERPIADLEEKLLELERLSSETGVNVDRELEDLRKKLEATKLKVASELTPWQKVQLARHPNRPYTLDYIERLFTDFVELHGDRRFADDPAVIGGFAKLNGRPVMVIGTQKGRNTRESVYRNFGCPHPEGYRKALRLMQAASLANLPILTLIDTPGAFPGVASEERHIGEAIAVNLRDMFALDVPVICTVIGEGGSGGALGLGVGNKVMLMENAYYSVITPEGCAAILWKDRAYSEKAAAALNLTAADLLRLGIIDEVIPEPPGGAHKDFSAAARALGEALEKALDEFSNMTPDELKKQRYQHFRSIDFYQEPGKKPAVRKSGAKKTAVKKTAAAKKTVKAKK